MEGLPERFRALRKARRLSSRGLGEPRFSVSYVSQIEHGKRRPSPAALEYFAWRLGVSPSFLATGVPDDLPLRLRYTLEEAEQAHSEGSFTEAREKAEGVQVESEPYDLPSVRQWARCIVAESLFGEGRFAEATEAWEALSKTPGLTQSDRVRATAGLARAGLATGDLRYAAQVVETFLEAEHDPPLDAAALAELHAILIPIYFERGDEQLSQRAADRALAALDESVPIRTQVVARHGAARVLAERGRWEEALNLAHEARTLMRTLHNRKDLAKLYTAHAFLCLEVDPPRVDEAVAQLDRAEKLFVKLGATSDLAYVQTERGRAAFHRGQYEEAVAHADRAAGTEGVIVLERARALYLRGRALGKLGRTDEARESLREALAVFEVNDAHHQAVLCWRELGDLATGEGDFEAAAVAYRSGVEVVGGGRFSLMF
jgi:tetratricopeptide (TPR) repeat protein